MDYFQIDWPAIPRLIIRSHILLIVIDNYAITNSRSLTFNFQVNTSKMSFEKKRTCINLIRKILIIGTQPIQIQTNGILYKLLLLIDTI